MDERVFDKKATELIKGTAIILMVYHHLFIHRDQERCFISLFDMLGGMIVAFKLLYLGRYV